MIVVAGMDGVLPSVVGGLVQCPVIAVPTSRGYGASFGRSRCAADDAQFLRSGCGSDEHRQRIRRGLPCASNQYAGCQVIGHRSFVIQENRFKVTNDQRLLIRSRTSSMPRFGQATITVRNPFSPFANNFVRTSYE